MAETVVRTLDMRMDTALLGGGGGASPRPSVGSPLRPDTITTNAQREHLERSRQNRYARHISTNYAMSSVATHTVTRTSSGGWGGGGVGDEHQHPATHPSYGDDERVVTIGGSASPPHHGSSPTTAASMGYYASTNVSQLSPTQLGSTLAPSHHASRSAQQQQQYHSPPSLPSPSAVTNAMTRAPIGSGVDTSMTAGGGGYSPQRGTSSSPTLVGMAYEAPRFNMGSPKDLSAGGPQRSPRQQQALVSPAVTSPLTVNGGTRRPQTPPSAGGLRPSSATRRSSPFGGSGSTAGSRPSSASGRSPRPGSAGSGRIGGSNKTVTVRSPSSNSATNRGRNGASPTSSTQARSPFGYPNTKGGAAAAMRLGGSGVGSPVNNSASSPREVVGGSSPITTAAAAVRECRRLKSYIRIRPLIPNEVTMHQQYVRDLQLVQQQLASGGSSSNGRSPRTPPTPVAYASADGNVPMSCVAVGDDGRSIRIADDSPCTLDGVFAPDTDPSLLVDSIVTPNISDAISGHHTSILLYGQTGSGKSYTMQELLPAFVEGLFSLADDTAAQYETTVTVEAQQIYLESISDLLDPSLTDLQIREFPDTGIYVRGAKEVTVRSAAEFHELWRAAVANRAIAATKMNHFSSRSHCIVTFSVKRRRKVTREQFSTISSTNNSHVIAGGGENSPTRAANGSSVLSDVNMSSTLAAIAMTTCGKVSFADLAGSERLKKSGSEGTRKYEAIAINQSLSTLGNVMQALADTRASHIPFRDSKLTRLLQESLAGGGSSCIVTTISPYVGNYNESRSSLAFAMRAMKVIQAVTTWREIDGKTRMMETQDWLENRVHILEERLRAMEEARLLAAVGEEGGDDEDADGELEYDSEGNPIVNNSRSPRNNYRSSTTRCPHCAIAETRIQELQGDVVMLQQDHKLMTSKCDLKVQQLQQSLEFALEEASSLRRKVATVEASVLGEGGAAGGEGGDAGEAALANNPLHKRRMNDLKAYYEGYVESVQAHLNEVTTERDDASAELVNLTTEITTLRQQLRQQATEAAEALEAERALSEQHIKEQLEGMAKDYEALVEKERQERINSTNAATAAVGQEMGMNTSTTHVLVDPEELANYKAMITHLKTTLSEQQQRYDTDLEAKQAALNASVEEVERLVTQLQEAKDASAKALKQRGKAHETAVAQLQHRLNEAESQKAIGASATEALQQQLEEVRAQLHSTEDTLRTTRHTYEGQVQTLTRDLSSAASEASANRILIATLESQIDAFKGTARTEADAAISGLQQLRSAHAEDVKRIEERHAAHMAEARRVNEALLEQLKEARDECADVAEVGNTRARVLERDLADSKAQLRNTMAEVVQLRAQLTDTAADTDARQAEAVVALQHAVDELQQQLTTERTQSHSQRSEAEASLAHLRSEYEEAIEALKAQHSTQQEALEQRLKESMQITKAKGDEIVALQRNFEALQTEHQQSIDAMTASLGEKDKALKKAEKGLALTTAQLEALQQSASSAADETQERLAAALRASIEDAKAQSHRMQLLQVQHNEEIRELEGQQQEHLLAMHRELDDMRTQLRKGKLDATDTQRQAAEAQNELLRRAEEKAADAALALTTTRQELARALAEIEVLTQQSVVAEDHHQKQLAAALRKCVDESQTHASRMMALEKAHQEELADVEARHVEVVDGHKHMITSLKSEAAHRIAEVNKLSNTIEALEGQLEQRDAHTAQLTVKQEALQKGINNLMADLQQSQDASTAEHKNVRAVTAAFKDLERRHKDDVDELTAELKDTKDALSTALARVSKEADEKAAFQQSLAVANARLVDLEGMVPQLEVSHQEALTQLSDQHAAALERAKHEATEGSTTELRHHITDLQQQLADEHSAHQDALAKERVAFDSKLTEITEANEAILKEMEAERKLLQHASLSRDDDHKAKLTSATRELAELKASLAVKETALKALEERLASQEHEHHIATEASEATHRQLSKDVDALKELVATLRASARMADDEHQQALDEVTSRAEDTLAKTVNDLRRRHKEHDELLRTRHQSQFVDLIREHEASIELLRNDFDVARKEASQWKAEAGRAAKALADSEIESADKVKALSEQLARAQAAVEEGEERLSAQSVQLVGKAAQDTLRQELGRLLEQLSIKERLVTNLQTRLDEATTKHLSMMADVRTSSDIALAEAKAAAEERQKDAITKLNAAHQRELAAVDLKHSEAVMALKKEAAEELKRSVADATRQLERDRALSDNQLSKELAEKRSEVLSLKRDVADFQQQLHEATEAHRAEVASLTDVLKRSTAAKSRSTSPSTVPTAAAAMEIEALRHQFALQTATAEDHHKRATDALKYTMSQQERVSADTIADLQSQLQQRDALVEKTRQTAANAKRSLEGQVTSLTADLEAMLASRDGLSEELDRAIKEKNSQEAALTAAERKAAAHLATINEKHEDAIKALQAELISMKASHETSTKLAEDKQAKAVASLEQSHSHAQQTLKDTNAALQTQIDKLTAALTTASDAAAKTIADNTEKTASLIVGHHRDKVKLADSINEATVLKAKLKALEEVVFSTKISGGGTSGDDNGSIADSVKKSAEEAAKHAQQLQAVRDASNTQLAELKAHYTKAHEQLIAECDALRSQSLRDKATIQTQSDEISRLSTTRCDEVFTLKAEVASMGRQLVNARELAAQFRLSLDAAEKEAKAGAESSTRRSEQTVAQLTEELADARAKLTAIEATSKASLEEAQQLHKGIADSLRHDNATLRAEMTTLQAALTAADAKATTSSDRHQSRVHCQRLQLAAAKALAADSKRQADALRKELEDERTRHVGLTETLEGLITGAASASPQQQGQVAIRARSVVDASTAVTPTLSHLSLAAALPPFAAVPDGTSADTTALQTSSSVAEMGDVLARLAPVAQTGLVVPATMSTPSVPSRTLTPPTRGLLMGEAAKGVGGSSVFSLSNTPRLTPSSKRRGHQQQQLLRHPPSGIASRRNSGASSGVRLPEAQPSLPTTPTMQPTNGPSQTPAGVVSTPPAAIAGNAEGYAAATRVNRSRRSRSASSVLAERLWNGSTRVVAAAPINNSATPSARRQTTPKLNPSSHAAPIPSVAAAMATSQSLTTSTPNISAIAAMMMPSQHSHSPTSAVVNSGATPPITPYQYADSTLRPSEVVYGVPSLPAVGGQFLHQQQRSRSAPSYLPAPQGAIVVPTQPPIFAHHAPSSVYTVTPVAAHHHQYQAHCPVHSVTCPAAVTAAANTSAIIL